MSAALESNQEASVKRNSYKSILAVTALMVFSAAFAAAQNAPQRQAGNKKASVQASKKVQVQTSEDMSETDMSVMKNEPHLVLAVAYRQNAEAFAKALHIQAQRAALSTDFARAAVTEISRSLDQAEEHFKEHMKTMGTDMPSKMAAMMEMRSSKVKEACRLLEKDVRDYTLNSKQIATDSVELLKRLDDMPKMQQPE